MALSEFGRQLDVIASHARAFSVLQESISLLKSQGPPEDPTAAQALVAATRDIGHVQLKFGRLEEAAAALEESIAVQQTGRILLPDVVP